MQSRLYKILKKPLVKWVGGVLGVIVLGAIGSGVWQIIGEPIVNYLTQITIDSISYIVKSYKDEIYLQASNGFHEANSLSLYIFMLMVPFFIMAYTFGKIRGKKAAKTNIGKSKFISDNLELSLYFIFISVFIISMASQKAYINGVITYVEVSLDRLKPYIKEKEITIIRAEFREVTNAKEYYKLYKKIEFNLKNHNLASKSIPPI